MRGRKNPPRKKNTNATRADRNAISFALPWNDQLRLYSEYAIRYAQAPARTPKIRPRSARVATFNAGYAVGISRSGIGRPAKKRRVGLTSNRAHVSARDWRALSVAMPVF